jgi:prefoldin subunit 5
MDSLDSEFVSAKTHHSIQFGSLERHVETTIDPLNSKLCRLSETFDEHKNQTAFELADQHTSLQSVTDHSAQELMQLSAKMNTLNSELASSNSQVSTQFRSLERHVDAAIDTLNTIGCAKILRYTRLKQTLDYLIYIHPSPLTSTPIQHN